MIYFVRKYPSILTLKHYITTARLNTATQARITILLGAEIFIYFTVVVVDRVCDGCGRKIRLRRLQ